MARKIPTLKARQRYRERLVLGLVFQPLRLFCDHCDGYVPSDLEWRCSHCHGENRRTTLYSFLNRCQHCKRPPKSYACPQCGKLNFLDKANDGTHPARRLEPPAVPPGVEEEQERKRRAHGHRKEDLEQEIVEAKLNAELERLKAASELSRKRSPAEKLEKSFAEHDGHVLAAHRIARREQALNAERYADDPEFRKRADESVAAWLERQLL